MVSVDTSSQISTIPELVEKPVSLEVKEESIVTVEEGKKNLSSGKKELNSSTQLSNSADISKGISFDGDYLEHFSEEELCTEGSPIQAEGNGIEEGNNRDSKMDTPSSLGSFSENLSTDSDSFDTDTTKSQGNATGYEKNYISQQQVLRKRFREVVRAARKTLAEARVAAQEESVAKRYEVAAEKKRELQRRRAEKRREMLFTPPSQHAQKKHVLLSKLETTGTAIAWDKTEMKEIRKIHAELDRAKAKKSQVSFRRDKRVSIVNTTALQPLTGKNSEFDKYEVDRLVKELHSLNLPEKASDLAHAFSRKVDTEKELRSQLKREKREAMLEAKRQKLEEMARLREEERRKKLEERDRKERERKEREEIERMKKLEEDRRKKIHNLHMWASFHRAGIANGVSRPYTSSYFPKLHDQAPAEEKKTSEYARICALRLRCHETHTKNRKTNSLQRQSQRL